MPSDEKGVALNYFPRPPENRIQGHIIRVMSGITQIGHTRYRRHRQRRRGWFMSLAMFWKYYRAGRVVMDQFRVLRDVESVKLPDELAGVLMVFRPFERVSYALGDGGEGCHSYTGSRCKRLKIHLLAAALFRFSGLNHRELFRFFDKNNQSSNQILAGVAACSRYRR